MMARELVNDRVKTKDSALTTKRSHRSRCSSHQVLRSAKSITTDVNAKGNQNVNNIISSFSDSREL
jgi:hypothetical protein